MHPWTGKEVGEDFGVLMATSQPTGSARVRDPVDAGGLLTQSTRQQNSHYKVCAVSEKKPSGIACSCVIRLPQPYDIMILAIFAMPCQKGETDPRELRR